MAHGSDDHGKDHGHDAGHGSDHAGGHHAPGPPETPAPPPPHVFIIARITRLLGLGMMAVFTAGVLYYWLLHTPRECGRMYGSAFCFLYGFCIWRAAAETLAREPGARTGEF